MQQRHARAAHAPRFAQDRLRRIRLARVPRPRGKCVRRRVHGIARSPRTAFRGAGQARHFPLHAGWAVARRYLRLQAALLTDDGKPGGKGGDRNLIGPPFKFAQHGRAGLWISSDIFPKCAEHADDLCLLERHVHRRPACIRRPWWRCTPARHSPARWAPGRSTASGPRMRNCRALSRSSPPAVGQQLWTYRLLPASYQGTRIGVQRRTHGGR